MADTLFWAEWFLLLSTVTMIILMTWSHFTKGTDHEFSRFTVMTTIALVTGYGLVLMIPSMVDNSVVLNPERFNKFLADAAPAMCGPVTLSFKGK